MSISNRTNLQETQSVVADGVGTFLDRHLPYAWTATVGKLVLQNATADVVADYSRDSHHLVPGSTATPPEGVRVRLLTEARFLSGEDARGALVVLEPETFPQGGVLSAILDRGGLGFVSDYSPARFEAPDDVPLLQGVTENGAWQADAETRPFLGFAVSPRLGVRLRTQAADGRLWAQAISDARRETGTVQVQEVTLPTAANLKAVFFPGEEVRLPDLGTRTALPPGAPTPWRDYAAGMVPTRRTDSLIREQVRVPTDERLTLPVGDFRRVFDGIVLGMDGTRNLAELLDDAECAAGVRLAPEAVKKCVLAVGVLGEWGYFDVVDPRAVTREQIVASLRTVGVVTGDVLLVHSALSAFGPIRGGAHTVLEALAEAVGPEGTVLMPCFQRPECILNGINTRWDHRPSDPLGPPSPATKWIGTLPLAFLRRHPEAVRGRQITHPWIGFGPRAAELLAQQGPEENPFSDNSVPALAAVVGAKILHLGSDLTRTTSLHHLEDHFNLPCLGPGFVSVKTPEGGVRYVCLPKMTPGPREFYTAGEEARFFREAKARGLVVAKAPLGLGLLKLMSARQLQEIGGALVAEDPMILVR